MKNFDFENKKRSINFGVIEFYGSAGVYNIEFLVEQPNTKFNITIKSNIIPVYNGLTNC